MQNCFFFLPFTCFCKLFSAVSIIPVLCQHVNSTELMRSQHTPDIFIYFFTPAFCGSVGSVWAPSWWALNVLRRHILCDVIFFWHFILFNRGKHQSWRLIIQRWPYNELHFLLFLTGLQGCHHLIHPLIHELSFMHQNTQYQTLLTEITGRVWCCQRYTAHI